MVVWGGAGIDRRLLRVTPGDRPPRAAAGGADLAGPVVEQPGLPAGEYGFCEHYCEDPGCDCRLALLIVHRNDSPQEWAAIGYGWEPPTYYKNWGPCTLREARRMSLPLLDQAHEQSPYAPLLLRAFAEIILDDEYKKRLARHYQIFKEGIRMLLEFESRAMR